MDDEETPRVGRDARATTPSRSRRSSFIAYTHRKYKEMDAGRTMSKRKPYGSAGSGFAAVAGAAVGVDAIVDRSDASVRHPRRRRRARDEARRAGEDAAFARHGAARMHGGDDDAARGV